MKSLLTLLEATAKAAVPVAVAGYVAFRAHLNRLGVSAIESLGLERYLAETFLLVSSLIMPTVLVVACMSLLVLLSRAIRLLTPSQWHNDDDRQPSTGLAIGVLLTLVAAYFVLLRRVGITWPDQGIVVGPLARERLSAPSGWPTITWLLAVCILTGAWLQSNSHAFANGAPATARLALHLCRGMLVVLAFHVPLVYGWAARPADYSRIRVDLKEPTETVCGLLVIESTQELRVWQAVHQQGIVVRVPRERIVRAVSGPVGNLTASATDAVTQANGWSQLCP